MGRAEVPLDSIVEYLLHPHAPQNLPDHRAGEIAAVVLGFLSQGALVHRNKALGVLWRLKGDSRNRRIRLDLRHRDRGH